MRRTRSFEPAARFTLLALLFCFSCQEGFGIVRPRTNPSSIDFGSIPIGNIQSQAETLTNTGNSQLIITGAAVTGTAFATNGLDLPLILDSNQQTTFHVTFAPASTTAYNGGITISYKRLDGGVWRGGATTIPLLGTGINQGQLIPNPANMNFGGVHVGSSQTLAGTLTNSGTSTLTISQATVKGTGFSMSGLSLPVTLSAGQSATFSLQFAPQSAGSFTGNITITSNAANPQTTVPLSGLGLGPGQLAASPSAQGFGSVQTGSRSTLPETITNSGSSAVTISQITATGAGFSFSGITPTVTLNAGQSITFDVSFAPQSSGAATGTLTVISNASNSTLSTPLSGTGTSSGQLAVTPSSISFGNVVVGTSQSQAASLSASGAAVTVSSLGVSGSEFSISGISLPVTIAAGTTASFMVTFKPQTSGVATTNVDFFSNASNSPTIQLENGTGTPPPQHSVTLTWNPDTSSNVVGYNIYRGIQSGGPYTQINSALDPSTTDIDNTVQGGQTYYYVVTAVNSSGMESSYSNQIQAVIPFP